MDTQSPNLNQGDSLEDSPTASTSSTSSQNSVADATSSFGKPGTSLEVPIGENAATTGPPNKQPNRLSRLLKKINIYALLFGFVLIAGAAVFFVALIATHSVKKPTVQTQSLDTSALKQLSTSNVTVGQPKQTLSVQSNAVFAGKVLIQDSLDVAGPIKVGGSLSIPGITVSGNSVFDQVQINKSLSVAGDAALQGQLSVQKSLSVAGGATFGGAISAAGLSVNSLQLSGDLNITHHIAAGGVTPGRSNGTALGSGGTSSVGGSDSAGSISINTGSAATAGCFLTVNFSQKYNATPHVLLTPIGIDAANLGYYVTRTTTSFAICAANTPPSFANFGFDYFVLD